MQPAFPSRICRAVLALVVPIQLTAQDLQYKSTTKLDMGGALNFAVKLAGGGEVTETHYLANGRLRTDASNSSTILDFEKRRIVTLDHKAKTYTAVGFDQMAAAARAMAAQARGELKAAREKGAARVEDDSVKVDFKFDLRVEPTGERERIAGQDAERYLMILKTDMTMTPEGGQTSEAGTLVLLMDAWNVKGGELVEAYQRLAQRELAEYRRAFGKQDVGALFMQDPKMRAALEKAAEEAQKIDGFTVRSTTHLVVVPPGVEFDAKAALAASSNSGGGNTAGNVARNVLRGAFGRALGGQQKQAEERKADEKPRQVTLLRVVTEVRDVQSKALPASLFEIPAGYKEVPFRGLSDR
ncbi:MAG TPA: hypothetical protein VNL96_02375 [Gemmatimonadaceae bacterium]|nr:hypothetical protein [Gemmatimonadaceae bacterium]